MMFLTLGITEKVRKLVLNTITGHALIVYDLAYLHHNFSQLIIKFSNCPWQKCHQQQRYLTCLASLGSKTKIEPTLQLFHSPRSQGKHSNFGAAVIFKDDFITVSKP
jgi:hypothetical protein